jgi:hypothetical protein
MNVTTVDGTNPASTTYSYPCPSVSPNSAIYFYQFTCPASKNVYWTTRFTIANAQGQSTPPTQSTQPGTNAPIPWGTGTLVNGTSGNSGAPTPSVPIDPTSPSVVPQISSSSVAPDSIQAPSDTPTPSTSPGQVNTQDNGATGMTVNGRVYTALALFLAVGSLFSGLL